MASVEKFSAGAVRNQLRHNRREIEHSGNPDIDPSRQGQDYVLSHDRGMTEYDYFLHRKSELYCYNRDDVKVMAGWIVTAPQDLDPARYDDFFCATYLTAPVGFSQHVIVYLQNLYTDDVYDLELYESNGLAAVEPNVLSGKYAFLSACVVGDAENRYQFSCKQNELSTETGADFHLTVTDTVNPERKMSTPSRDQNVTVQAANGFNNRDTVAAEQPIIEPGVVSQPVKQQEKQFDLLSLLLDFMPVVLVGAVLFAIRRKRCH